MMKLRLLSVIICVLISSILVGAQVQKGTITGTVVDQQGSSVPNAKVTVRDMQTGAVYNAVSSNAGEFTVPGLAFGAYQVIIEMPGFRKWETSNVQVITAQESSVKATLQVGETTDTVTVEAAQAVIDTTSAELNTNVSRKQIVDLPTATRNPMEFVGLQAGVTGPTGTRTSVINGLRGATNNVTQDGINIQDNFIKSDGLFAQSSPTVENTGEFSISTQNVGSDSGFGVAQVRITTPRGTNVYHGSLFYFHRNDAFNANDFVNNELGLKKDKLRQHRFGGNVGGPIFLPKIYHGKDKTFFFFRYEGFREHLSQPRNRTVLTQSARQGLFSYRDAANVQHTVNLLTASSRGLGLNPFTKSLIDATPFPNNNAVGDGFGNTAGFLFGATGADPDDRYTIRIDHKAIDSHRWGTHWVEVDANWSNFAITPDFGNNNDASFPPGVAVNCTGGVCLGGGQFPRRRQLSAAINSTLGSTMFNEFRFGFFRPFSAFTREAAFPRSFRVAYPTAISALEQNFLSSGRFTPSYTFIDNFTKIRGAHNVKLGFQVLSTSSRPFSDAGTIPTVSIGSNTTNSDGLTINSFPGLGSDQASTLIFNRARAIYQTLVGLENTVQQTFNAADPTQGFIPGATSAESYKLRTYAWYGSDSWRMRPNLTVNYGLRYELSPAVTIVNKRGVQPVNFLPGLFLSGPLFQVDPSVKFGDLLSGNVAPTKLVPAGFGDLPLWNTDKKDFAPFIGIAWQPTGRTVIRSGFSVSYTRDGLDVVSNAVTGNSGLQTNVTQIISSSSTDPGVINPSKNFAQPTPALVLPISQLDNFIQNSGTGSTLFTFDHNLRNPYVLQWSFGIERQLSNSTALEVRYVGNHAVRLLRGFDFNQVNLTPALLNEFKGAANNLAICTANRKQCTGSDTGTTRFDNRGLPMQVPLPLLESIRVPSSFFTDGNFANDLRTNGAGNFWFNIQNLCTFRFFQNSGSMCPGLSTLPANLFVANPLAFGADVITNGSSSTYHGLQMEFRRRLTRGFQFQGNYTFAKVLTDSSGSATNFDAFLDLNNPRFDRTRALFDIRHTFHFNGIWEIPVGRGRRFLSSGVLGKFLEGWQTGTIWTWRSGAPITIASGFGTINRSARSTNKSTAVPVGMSAADVCSQVGVYKTANGAFFLPENFFVRGTGVGTKTANFSLLTNPGPGQLGAQGLNLGCSGPSFINFDMNLVKRTRITERVNFEFRSEFFNIFNHANFFVTQQPNNINNPGFASLNNSANVFSGREIQFNFRLNF